MNIQGVGQAGQENYASLKLGTEKSTGNIKEMVPSSKDTKEGSELSPKSVENVAKKLDGIISDYGVHTEYELHDRSQIVMLKIVDDNTGNVISEIPAKKILDMIAKFSEMVGIIIDKKA